MVVEISVYFLLELVVLTRRKDSSRRSIGAFRELVVTSSAVLKYTPAGPLKGQAIGCLKQRAF